jgi:hypothetical protein
MKKTKSKKSRDTVTLSVLKRNLKRFELFGHF